MNQQAILALLGDLYQQVTTLQAKIAQLEARLDGPKSVVK